MVSRASNQRGQGGDTLLSDLTDSHPKQSDENVSSKESKGGGKTHASTQRGAEPSGSPHSRHTADSGRRTVKDIGERQDEDGLATVKSLSRPGSISPSTQKANYSRSVESSLTRGLAEPYKEGVRTNHSRGNSMTQSLTPDLSPRSTLSDSSSSGSLRQEVDDVVGVGEELHGKQSAEVECCGEGVSNGGVLEDSADMLNSKSLRANVTDGVRTDNSEGYLQGNYVQRTLITSSKYGVRPPQEGVAIPVVASSCTLPPVATSQGGTAEGNSPPMSSPPGLSKARTQPLSLSTQSESVCRRLDLSDKPSPLLTGHCIPLHQQTLGRGGAVGGVRQPAVEGERSGLVTSTHGKYRVQNNDF